MAISAHAFFYAGFPYSGFGLGCGGYGLGVFGLGGFDDLEVLATVIGARSLSSTNGRGKVSHEQQNTTLLFKQVIVKY